MLKRIKRQPTLQRIISKALHCSRWHIHVADPRYDLIDDKAMSEFMAYDYTENKKWKKDIWDCDNFSIQFMASAQRYFAQRGINAAIGIIWADKHAFNLSVSPDFKVDLWEPQTDLRAFLTARVKLVVI